MPPCYPYTHFFRIVIIMGRGVMLLLQLSQCISSGCHHATLTPNIFLEVSLLLGGALRFRFDLASVIIQGATMPNLNPKFFGIVIIEGRGLYVSAST